jgi:hypothetical protein
LIDILVIAITTLRKREACFNVNSDFLCTFLLTASADDSVIGRDIERIFVKTELFLQ